MHNLTLSATVKKKKDEHSYGRTTKANWWYSFTTR